jgi:hypothetical protein
LNDTTNNLPSIVAVPSTVHEPPFLATVSVPSVASEPLLGPASSTHRHCIHGDTSVLESNNGRHAAYCTELNEAELIQALADAEKGKALPSAILSMDKMRKMDAWLSWIF